jgi:hypothetical protein
VWSRAELVADIDTAIARSGNLVGLFAGVIGVIFFDQLGVGGFWLLSLTGFAASVVVLYQGGENVEGQGGQPYVYKVPPNAPPGWPGTDLD